MSQSATVQAAFGLFDGDSSDEEEVTNVSSIPLLNLVVPTSKLTLNDSPQKSSSSLTPPIKCLYGPWDDVKPGFVGDIELVSEYKEIGGHRGYIATKDLEPGTLVLIEKVYVPWPPEEKVKDRMDPKFFITTLEMVLQQKDQAKAKEIQKHLSHLYPHRLEDLPAYLLEEGEAKYGPFLKELLVSSGTNSTYEELLQNIFAMQCNAFDSGIFLYNALFNHECNPNCIKFSSDNDKQISEVRVTRKILQGQPLSISYLFPREQSKETRQEILKKQFGFECQCTLCQRGDSILSLSSPPPTSPTSSLTTNKRLQDIEQQLTLTENLLKGKGFSIASTALTMVLETLSDALELIGHDHLILIRIHKLVADCCDGLLKSNTIDTIDQKKESCILFLQSNFELLELQQIFLGEKHIDLARTFHDLSQGIQFLLSIDYLNQGKIFIQEFPDKNFTNLRQISGMENYYRQKFQQLKQLYDA
jgi:hypothetical protein